MALLYKVRSSHKNLFNYLLINLMRQRGKSMAVDVDALDVFTTQLVQEKSNKWDSLKLKKRIIPISSNYKLEKVFKIEDGVTTKSLRDMLHEGILENNPGKLITILEMCRDRKMAPFGLIKNVLLYFAQIGHVEGIELIRKIYEDVNPAILQVHGDFQHFFAEAVWVRGNIPKALVIFSEVYRKNKVLHRNIHRTLNYLFYNASQKNSEAIMVAISRFAEDLLGKFNDYVPIVNLWKICILSEWYGDQVLAMDLLDRHKDLFKHLLAEIPYLAATALKRHQIESVYKLLEVLLQYDCKLECSGVLVALFNYKFRQRDFYGCSQILQWSRKYDIELPSLQQKKVLQLLLDVRIGQVKKPVKQLDIKDYSLKF